MVKCFNLSIEYVLYEMSYVNLVLYSAVIPSYHSEKNRSKKSDRHGKVINADMDTAAAEKMLKALS